MWKMANSTDSESVLYEVERILQKSKTSQGLTLYKVRWKGYGPEDDTWEPKKNLESCQDMIEEYEKKQSELAKKRAERRRAKKALQEEKLETESSDDSNGLYPSTFKNTFWKELEAGRVDLFGNDMYSKVKNKHASNQTTDSSNNETGSSQSFSVKEQNTSSKSSCSSKKSTPLKSQQKRGTKEHSKSHKSSTLLEFSDRRRCSVKILSDSDSDENNEGFENSSNNTEKDSSKSGLNFVIKKYPELVDKIDSKCAVNSPVPSPCYTVLPKEVSHVRESSSRKKKSHKHKHRKSSKKSKIQSSRERKRKLSASSTANVYEKSVKEPRLENLHDVSNEEGEIRDASMESCDVGGDVESVTDRPFSTDVENSPMCVDNVTDSSVPKGMVLNPTSVENKDFVKSDNSKPSFLDLSSDPNQAPMFCTNSPGNSVNNNSDVKVPSVDSCRGSSVSTTNSDMSVLTPGEADTPVFTNFTDTVSNSDQQNLDAFDSGLSSPASEKNSLGERKEQNDTYREPIPPLLAGVGRSYNKGLNQELDIDLDDLDWEMFDREVTMEPINISNFEFAEAVRCNNYELVKRALKGDGKYDMNSADQHGKTLLMHTVQQGSDDISDLLVENGADINAQMNSGLTPLMIACQCAEVSTVNLLLELGAKVNMAAGDGRTALIISSKRGHTQILWLLLECGANFNMACHSGHTAMDFVKHLRFTEMENILSNHMHRVMNEFNKQVSITLNQTAKIVSALFPAQLFNICEGDKFEYTFQHRLLPPDSGVGYLLFIGQAMFTSEEVQCRLYGPCAVKSVYLNGHQQSKLTEGGNFVLAFSPLVNGRNVITINTVKAQEAKAKLIMCAYKAQLLEM